MTVKMSTAYDSAAFLITDLGVLFFGRMWVKWKGMALAFIVSGQQLSCNHHSCI